MKQNSLSYIRLAGWLLGIGIMLPSCSWEEEQAGTPSDGTIRVHTSISGRDDSSVPTGKEEEPHARLLFWEADDYHKMIGGKEWTARPFLDILPTENIDFYRVEGNVPFNTRHSYPIGDKKIHVMGFSPATLTPKDNYKTLEIPLGMQDGKTDFLSGDGSIERIGSSSDPFDGENRASKQLEFCHLTAQILVLAKRAPGMAQKTGVRNVKVTVYGQQVPTTLKWLSIDVPKELGGYFPASPIEIQKLELAHKTPDPILLNMAQRVDSCYVYADPEGGHAHGEATSPEPGGITLTLDIEAELFPFDPETGTWDESQAYIQRWEGQTVTINSNTGTAMKMGYLYTVTITFDILDIHLQGVEMEWEDGHTHYIPISPVNKPDDGTEQKGGHNR